MRIATKLAIALFAIELVPKIERPPDGGNYQSYGADGLLASGWPGRFHFADCIG
jgi:hypothetical protein